METSFTKRLGCLDLSLVVSYPDDTERDGTSECSPLFSLALDLRNLQAAFLIIIGKLLEDPSRVVS